MGEEADPKIGREKGETKERKEVTEGRDLAREQERRPKTRKTSGTVRVERVRDKGGAQRGAANRILQTGEQERWARGQMGQRELTVPWARDTLEGAPDEAGAEKGSRQRVTDKSALDGAQRDTQGEEVEMGIASATRGSLGCLKKP